MSEYERRIRIEGALSLELARNVILPVVQEDLTARLDLLDKSCRTNISVSAFQDSAQRFAAEMNNLINECSVLENMLQSSGTADILSSMERLRKTVDYLETQVDDRRWPLPKYREMLFIY